MVSSITGGTVNVNVDGHTEVTGSVIAAVDSEGNETGELQLSTGSLEVANLTNHSHSSSYTNQNESNQSLDKTLAAIGEVDHQLLSEKGRKQIA